MLCRSVHNPFAGFYLPISDTGKVVLKHKTRMASCHTSDAAWQAAEHLGKRLGCKVDVLAGACLEGKSDFPSGCVVHVSQEVVESKKSDFQKIIGDLAIGSGMGIYKTSLTQSQWDESLRCLPNGIMDVRSVLQRVHDQNKAETNEHGCLRIGLVLEEPGLSCRHSLEAQNDPKPMVGLVIHAAAPGTGSDVAALIDNVQMFRGAIDVAKKQSNEKRGIVAKRCTAELSKLFENVQPDVGAQLKSAPILVAHSCDTSVDVQGDEWTIRRDVSTQKGSGGDSAIVSNGWNRNIQQIASGLCTQIPTNNHYRLDDYSRSDRPFCIGSREVLALIANEKHPDSYKTEFLKSKDTLMKQCTGDTATEFAPILANSHDVFASPVGWHGTDAGMCNPHAIPLSSFPPTTAHPLKGKCYHIETAIVDRPATANETATSIAFNATGTDCWLPATAASLAEIERVSGTLSADVLSQFGDAKELGGTRYFQLPSETAKRLREDFVTSNIDAINGTCQSLMCRINDLNALVKKTECDLTFSVTQ